MPLVATQVKRRRGTGVENDAFAGAEGEITVDLTNKELRVHDGSGKLGGFRIGRHTDRSNCITEIPQNIKLELSSDGTLTLKAGSKVYVPNGAGVFDVVTIANDLTATSTSNEQNLIFLFNGGLGSMPIKQCFSGSSAPSAYQYMFWYDTTNNLVKFTSDSGSTWTANSNSLSLGLVTASSSKITSIDQVFNGFGYIGSTLFVLPNIKGFVPYGRNPDGTAKNQQYTTTTVRTWYNNNYTFNNFQIGISTDGDVSVGQYNYDLKTNTTTELKCIVGNITGTSGRIDSITTKTVFQFLDYNDTEFIGHQSMPSDRRLSLSLGASGSIYTAPADGWFFISKVATGANQFVILKNINYNVFRTAGFVPSAGFWAATILPVKKGDNVMCEYDAGGALQGFGFVYAEGSK